MQSLLITQLQPRFLKVTTSYFTEAGIDEQILNIAYSDANLGFECVSQSTVMTSSATAGFIDSEESSRTGASTVDASDAFKKAGRALPVDLRMLEYVDGYDKNLMCPICHCPFVEGTKLPCDHTFCKHCVLRAFQSQSQERKTCPSCRSDVNTLNLMPVPRFIGHMVDDLMVRCPNHTEGCTKTLRRSDVQYHADTDCQFAEVECPLSSCRLRILRKLCGSDCLHGYVDCTACQTKLMMRYQEQHLNEQCTVRKWPCPHCQASVVASSRRAHEEECSEAPVTCSGSAIGCTFVDKRIAVHTHQKSCPMALMSPAFSTMASRVERQEAAMNSLRHRNTVLESGLESLKTLVDTLSLPSTSGSARASEFVESSATTAQETAVTDAPFDSAAHHLLLLHETLREEIERVSNSVTDLDARASLMIMNENLRLKEDMAHLNAMVSSMRMQLQWLMSARLQAQQRPSLTAAMQGAAATMAGRTTNSEDVSVRGGPVRRLSDSTTKL